MLVASRRKQNTIVVNSINMFACPKADIKSSKVWEQNTGAHAFHPFCTNELTTLVFDRRRQLIFTPLVGR